MYYVLFACQRSSNKDLNLTKTDINFMFIFMTLNVKCSALAPHLLPA